MRYVDSERPNRASPPGVGPASQEEEMTQNITITVPDELGAKLEKWRDRMDISKVCQKALQTAVFRLEHSPNFGKDLEATLERLRTEKENSYSVGWEVGVEYVKNEADLAEVRRLRNLEFSLFMDLPPSCRDIFKQLTARYAGDEGCMDGEFRDLPLNQDEYLQGCGDAIRALAAFLEDKI